MKKGIAVVGLTCMLAAGCATMSSNDDVRAATLRSVGAEQIAWQQHAKPAGMESVVALTTMNAHIDSITVTSPSEATVVATYKYTGRFATDRGERTGTVTVQRKLHFTKSSDGWNETGTREEIARSTSWSNNGVKQAA